MEHTAISELEQLGLEVARRVAGPDAIEQVEVRTGVDADDRPAYHFTFLVDPRREQNGRGLVFIRVHQQLRDELEARGDTHLPLVRMLDRADWAKRRRARST